MLRNAVLHGRKMAARHSAAICTVRKGTFVHIRDPGLRTDRPLAGGTAYLSPFTELPASMSTYDPVLSTSMALST